MQNPSYIFYTCIGFELNIKLFLYNFPSFKHNYDYKIINSFVRSFFFLLLNYDDDDDAWYYVYIYKVCLNPTHHHLK